MFFAMPHTIGRTTVFDRVSISVCQLSTLQSACPERSRRIARGLAKATILGIGKRISIEDDCETFARLSGLFVKIR
jgi:hypothetical protein